MSDTTATPQQVEFPTLSGKFTYTLSEAADILRVKYGTLAKWVRTGKIEVCPTGKPYRIPAKEMLRLIGQPLPTV